MRQSSGPVGHVAPALGLFLDTAVKSGMTYAQLVQPNAALELLSEARATLDPWAPDIDRLLDANQLVSDAAADLLLYLYGDDAAKWLREPMDASSQMIVFNEFPATGLPQAVDRGLTWENYVQRPSVCALTSTRRGNDTSVHTIIRNHVGDLEPSAGDELVQFLPPRPARTFEIKNAEDWLTVCRLRGEPTSPEDWLPYTDSYGFVSPSWSHVTRFYDAVHISFLGFLETWLVVASKNGMKSKLWAWDGECSVWLTPPVSVEPTGNPNSSLWV